MPGSASQNNQQQLLIQPQPAPVDPEIQQLQQKLSAHNQRDLVWDIQWQDFGIHPEQLSLMQPHQRVNHFLGMYNIARKNTLSIHLKRFQKEFPDHYNFFPRTWLYPSENGEIQEYYQEKMLKRKQAVEDGRMTKEQSDDKPPVVFIAKPEAGCQGRGIFIAKTLESLQHKINAQQMKEKKELEEYIKAEEHFDTAQRYSNTNSITAASSNFAHQDSGISDVQPRGVEPPEKIEKGQQSYVVQKYIKQPALWKQHKYDFRIYVLITSVIDPMTIFLYQDGLVRLASEKYDQSGKNVNDPYTHLTNYSLNKKNKNFDNQNHKLKLTDCLRGIMSQPPTAPGKPAVHRSAKEIWAEIEAMVVKTIITVQPQLQHIYRSCQTKEPDCCFELLGFDVMLDQKLKPWMLEVNHTPSFQSDTETDAQVKNNLIRNTLEIIQMGVENRKRVAQEMKQEMKQQIQQNAYKRLSAKEHSDRVRFDPNIAMQKVRDNKFKLIYPKEAPGSDPDLYTKLQERATQIWKASTGTYNPQPKPKEKEEKEKEIKPKKPKKKKKPKPAVAKEEDADAAADGDEQEETKTKSDLDSKIKKGSATIGKDQWPPHDLMNQDEAAEMNDQNENDAEYERNRKDEPVEQLLPKKAQTDTYNFVEANKRRNTIGNPGMQDRSSRTFSIEEDAKLRTQQRPLGRHQVTVVNQALQHTTQCIQQNQGRCIQQPYPLPKDEAFHIMAAQTAGWNSMAPCMQCLIISESIPNQITHGNARMSVNSGSMNRQTMYAHVQNSMQPTESSKAKVVPTTRPGQKGSYSVQVQPKIHDPNQVQLPFPIHTYTRQQLERMGISPSTFNNLPVMTNAELQSQIRNELIKAITEGKKIPNPNGGPVMYDYQVVKGQANQKNGNIVHVHVPVPPEMKQTLVNQINSIKQQQARETNVNASRKGKGSLAVNGEQALDSNMPQNIQIKDQKIINELFNVINDETGVM